MLIVEYESVELDACPDCLGLWFDAQELTNLFELAGAPQRLFDLENQLARLPEASPRRKCPRCRGRVVPVRAPSTAGDLILDKCPRGHGLWFDQGELDALLKGVLGEQSEALDNVRAYLGQFASPARSEEERASEDLGQ